MAGHLKEYEQSLQTIRTILNDPAAFKDGKPQFTSVEQLDRYITSKGFTLTKNHPFGPTQEFDDARQLIYEGPNNTVLKFKTRGYETGPRKGTATMSLEATDGRGGGWEDVLFKVDVNGKILAKNEIGVSEEIVPLPADNPDRVKTGVLYGVKNAETGRVRPIVKFEVIHGGKSGPFDKDAWADRGHLDMPTGF